MRTALLHYWLTNMRGGENVFAELCRMFPDGDIYTHIYEPSGLGEGGAFLRGRRVHESYIGRLPFMRRHFRQMLPLMGHAARQWDFSGCELIISSESGPVKGIVKPSEARHICYCHTPMRYIWDMYDDYLAHADWAAGWGMRLLRDRLRREDLRSADAVDIFVANSCCVAERIKRIYRRDAAVVYPPVDVAYFRKGVAASGEGAREYYLCAGELVPYKRADLAIECCKRMGKRLIVCGGGVWEKHLRRLAPADPLIEFTGRVSRERLRELYGNAAALLFPGVEDFGIVPLEAQSAGTPVVAFGAGGALETVKPGVSGLFFAAQNIDAMCETLEEASCRKWDRQKIAALTDKFSPERFRTEIGAVINGVMAQKENIYGESSYK